jgi:hypothetical protein
MILYMTLSVKAGAKGPLRQGKYRGGRGGPFPRTLSPGLQFALSRFRKKADEDHFLGGGVDGFGVGAGGFCFGFGGGGGVGGRGGRLGFLLEFIPPSPAKN